MHRNRVTADLYTPQYVLYPEKTKTSSDKDYMMVDVYSYAMLVWHIFTRQLPYGGRRMVRNEIEKELHQKHVSADCSMWSEMCVGWFIREVYMYV